MMSSRNQIIDAYRGIAILGVMAFHYTLRWPEICGYSAEYSEVFRLGRYGVPLFFVVSGLVITMTVLRSENALQFGVRRAARLYPAFVAAAVFTFLVMRFFGPERFQFSAWDLLASLTMDARALGANYIDGAYWSLAVELKFYLCVALARLLLKDRFWMGILAVAVLSALPLGSTWAYVLIAEWWPYLLLGMSGWYLIYEHRKREGIALGVASVLLYILHRPEGLLVDFLIWFLALAMLVLLKVSPSWAPLPVRWLAWIGSISYSLYLLHQNLGVTLIGRLTRIGVPDIPAMIAAAGAMIAIAYFSFTYIEKPGARVVMALYGRIRGSGPARQPESAPA